MKALLLFVIVIINFLLTSAREPKEWWQSTVVRKNFRMTKFPVIANFPSHFSFIKSIHARSKTQMAMASETSKASYPSSLKFILKLTKRFAGITSKLEYLKEAGVGATWLSPIFKSPMAGLEDDKRIDIDGKMTL
jgi:Alpha amylase, catalytic domain